MATNYMTVNEHEIDNLNARLWRIQQAIENHPKEKDLGAPALDLAIMKFRYKVTKLLRNVLFMQHYVWECAEESEYEAWNKECPDPEELVKQFNMSINFEMAEGQYKDELEDCDQFGPDINFLPIYDPLSWWKDLSPARKKEFEDEAKACLESFKKA